MCLNDKFPYLVSQTTSDTTPSTLQMSTVTTVNRKEIINTCPLDRKNIPYYTRPLNEKCQLYPFRSERFLFPRPTISPTLPLSLLTRKTPNTTLSTPRTVFPAFEVIPTKIIVPATVLSAANIKNSHHTPDMTISVTLHL